MTIVPNHPSADLWRSPEDIDLIGRMKEAGHHLSIKIRDPIDIGYEELTPGPHAPRGSSATTLGDLMPPRVSDGTNRVCADRPCRPGLAF